MKHFAGGEKKLRQSLGTPTKDTPPKYRIRTPSPYTVLIQSCEIGTIQDKVQLRMTTNLFQQK